MAQAEKIIGRERKERRKEQELREGRQPNGRRGAGWRRDSPQGSGQEREEISVGDEAEPRQQRLGSAEHPPGPPVGPAPCMSLAGAHEHITGGAVSGPRSKWSNRPKAIST